MNHKKQTIEMFLALEIVEITMRLEGSMLTNTQVGFRMDDGASGDW